MNWRKRTEKEIEESIKKKDYTGGYEFLPWLWYMRRMYVVGFFGNLAAGIYGFVSFFQEGDWVSLGVGIFFGLFAAPLIAYMLIKDYNESKKGNSM